MQQLHKSTDLTVSADVCARELLSGVPAIMRYLRYQMRRHRHRELTVPQFRALIFLAHHNHASLSEIAEHLGVSLPAMSRMVETLVKRGLMRRSSSTGDRRRISLSLTGRGRSTFRIAHRAARRCLAERLGDLPAREVSRVTAAMRVLVRVFSPDGEKSDGAGR
jgi:MarR family transcriptional regulator for hemolysin